MVSFELATEIYKFTVLARNNMFSIIKVVDNKKGFTDTAVVFYNK